MAATQFAFGQMNADNDQAMFAAGATVEAEEPTTSNAATTAAASATQAICRVATDTAVYVSFGAAPNASSDAVRFMCPANSVSFFRVSAGDKGAVVTVASE